MRIMSLFMTILVAQAFFSIFITGMAYTMPADASGELNDYTGIANSFDLGGLSDQVSENVQSQTQMPIIEMGALVFYSGNLIVDLMGNFVFAVPEMLTILIHGITELINIPDQFQSLIQLFAQSLFTVLYFLGIIQLLLNLRSSSAGAV